jgi:DNA-binding transcriptional ArsR family regulator
MPRPDAYRKHADMFRALAHPARLRMLVGLRRQVCNVSRLWRDLGISQPLASQHLLRLRQAGLVIGERRGRQTCYRLADPKLNTFLDAIDPHPPARRRTTRKGVKRP